ncbi:hypothetical protein E5676_scaffold475G00530 [Cucumis melo var. makuwa]|uniref:Uncharacterized protein n=2 Tax=Cucumis melo TaxID=3656 RepID=A0A5D3CCW9_CUCMM|nr:hypothetical protein E6C27_scaffold65G005250 [Cucumis melo var. makuwa]TYK09064.1 hypothetical protein E5676_scaffold475G00530 [Cucumis melo var. makuwa]
MVIISYYVHLREEKEEGSKELDDLRKCKPKKIRGGFSHDGGEFIEANNAVAVGIGLPHHLGEFAVGERMPHFRHGTSELGGGDVSITITIERSENLHQLLLIDENIVVHIGENGIDEFIEFDGAVAVGIHVGEERMELVAGGFDAERAEEGAEFELGETAVGIHVETPENVVELLELVVGLNGSHGIGMDFRRIDKIRKEEMVEDRMGKEIGQLGM